jgi:hypothetical protein
MVIASKHEAKNCPRCHEEFECKLGSVSLCQCYSVRLTVEESDFISSRFSDCLCANCLLTLKIEYGQWLHLTGMRTD